MTPLSVTSGILAGIGSRYWSRNLPVMPVRGKAAFLPAWDTYCREMPTTEQRAGWLREFGAYNAGLPLGPCAGVAVLDVDTDDPRVWQVVEAVMPASPWRRVGKKGAALAYRFSGLAGFKIKETGSRRPLIEFLSTGNQLVMPPSIHPETQRPYQSN